MANIDMNEVNLELTMTAEMRAAGEIGYRFKVRGEVTTLDPVDGDVKPIRVDQAGFTVIPIANLSATIGVTVSAATRAFAQGLLENEGQGSHVVTDNT